jgi:hypothetical protein
LSIEDFRDTSLSLNSRFTSIRRGISLEFTVAEALVGSSIFQHTRDARTWIRQSARSLRVLDGPFDSRWEPGFHKNLHRAPFQRFAHGDDLIKYGCILRIWIRIPRKGTRCSPLTLRDQARSLRGRGKSLSIRAKCGNTRTDRLTHAAYAVCHGISNSPYRAFGSNPPSLKGRRERTLVDGPPASRRTKTRVLAWITLSSEPD